MYHKSGQKVGKRWAVVNFATRFSKLVNFVKTKVATKVVNFQPSFFKKWSTFACTFLKLVNFAKEKIVRRTPFSHKFTSSYRHINVVQLRVLFIFIPEFDFSTQNINVEKRFCHESCDVIPLTININSGASVIRSTSYRYLSVFISFTDVTVRAYFVIRMSLNFRPSFFHTNVLSEKVKGPATTANPFGI